MASANLQRWLDYHQSPSEASLMAMLHQDAVFHSPVVHRPQAGRALTFAYLNAATKVMFPAGFEYLRVFDCDSRAVLEFRCEIEGTVLNGVDMIEWDEAGLITDFKVMLRPAKALSAIQERMGEMLARQGGKANA